MKKKNQDVAENQEATTDIESVSNAQQENKVKKKKLSKLKLLYILWNVIMFCIYIALDVNKIVKYGWTAINIIVTAFLGLQIILFAVFTLIGAKDKQQSQKQKVTMKLVKKTKKITLKLLTVITSVLMLVGIEGAMSFSDILTLIVAIISLLLAIISFIKLIRKQNKISKKQKAKQEKLEAKQIAKEEKAKK